MFNSCLTQRFTNGIIVIKNNVNSLLGLRKMEGQCKQ